MSKYGTNYLETEALLAAQEGDQEELDRLLAQMLPGELTNLSNAAENLSSEALIARQDKLKNSAT